MTTAPYDVRATTALQDSIEHVHYVYATHPTWTDPIPLELITSSITYDEEQTPHVVFNATCRIPEDQATLNLLDARTGVRVEVFAGYVYDDGTPDVHRIARLILDQRNVRRPDNTMTIRAASDELLVQRWTALGDSKTYTPTTLAGWAIADLIRWAVPSASITERLPPQSFVDPGDALVVGTGDDVWSAIQDIADRVGAWVYHDGNTGWNVVPSPTRASGSTAVLRTGEGGTITGSESVIGTEQFANTVLVRYRWRDSGGVEHIAAGWAQITSGPYSVAAVGRVALVIENDRKGTAAQARSSAANMVRRSVTRGRSLSVEFSNAPYWLRPGQTISVQLPTGPQARHFASRVDLDLPSGTGHVRTRQPENVTIITGE